MNIEQWTPIQFIFTSSQYTVEPYKDESAQLPGTTHPKIRVGVGVGVLYSITTFRREIRESGPVGQLPQCDHWYRNLRRPCVRTTACLNSRIPAAGVSATAPCRLNKTQQSNCSKLQAPDFQSLDGVVCVLLCVELNPCRLHVVLLS